MNNLRQVFFGVLAALLSFTITIGGLYLAFVEGGEQLAASAPTATFTVLPTLKVVTPAVTYSLPSPTAIRPIATQVPGEPTFTPSPTRQPTATFTPAPPSNCQPPADWFAVTVQPGDSLASLAEFYHTTPEALAQANCLLSDNLVPGSVLFVPGLPPTEPPEPCGPPSGWVFYTVRSGDTLYQISLKFGVSVAQLQFANCMGSSTLIHAGQNLYVPFYLVPTRTPRPTPTIWPTDTDTPVPTEPPTATATFPPPGTATSTPTSTSTPPSTAVPTESPTPFPTDTATPTLPPTEMPTPTLEPTETPSPTVEPTVTPTPPPR